MSKMLSIIIPVFNAELTLQEAVDSIFRQNLQMRFEVIIVDDGSTDNSPTLIKKLAKKHKEIRSVFHQNNLGGGATRNTAVAHSSGDYIFCLDSDDMLGDTMLQPMVDLLENKKCDGVGIHISKKFIGNNVHRIAFTTTFKYSGMKVPFESLFENSTCSLYSTFLITKKAFMLCGGYPTSHGFDTQSMAFRFLANGLTAYTCPQAVYLHRVNHSRSYYIREYEAGRTSENWMQIYEEFFYLFSVEVKRRLLYTDMINGNNLSLEIVRREKDKFVDHYKQYLQPKAKELYKEKVLSQKTQNPYDIYWLGIIAQEKDDHATAVELFSQVIRMGLDTQRVYQKLLNSLSKMTGKTSLSLQKRIILLEKISMIQQIRLLAIRLINDTARIVRKLI